ncbi:MAG: ADP-ribose pyrophosphatase [Tenericutes bacterium HGW-Tenericutes-2]|jgi:ADP-ribose pyrophosphatase|nr:MAG: ADP-ribose pyrophosphatase [Tenericutes bacterium HGW-Tenericutes-2]
MIEKTKSSKKIYEGNFISFYEDEVYLPNGNTSQRVLLKHPGAASILAITKDKKIILTKQYRYPIQKISLEIPAGKKDHPTEDGLTCAMRELEEETGYQSSNYKKIFTFHPAVGFCDEVLDIFIAYDCEKIEKPASPDADEFIEVEYIERNQINNLLKSGAITDGKTIIALQYYLLHE